MKGDAKYEDLSLSFYACTGATSTWLWSGSPAAALGLFRGGSPPDHREPLQLSETRALGRAKVVSITIGWNDLNLDDVFTYCSHHACANGDRTKDPWVNGIDRNLNVLRLVLTATYARIRAEAPNAQLFVVGYPDVLSSRPTSSSCRALPHSSDRSLLFLASKETALNEAVRAAAASVGAVFVDPNSGRGRSSFRGHDVCSKKSGWFGAPQGETLPNARGELQLARALEHHLALTPVRTPTCSVPAAPGVDYAGCTFVDAGFFGDDLAGADLEGADLTGSSFYRSTNIAGADLSGANLDGANFYGVNLSNANLSRANLEMASSMGVSGAPFALPARWKLIGGFLLGPKALLEHDDLDGLDLAGVDLAGALLKDADLYCANLSDGADLTRADLTGANVTYTNLSRDDLVGVDLSGQELYGIDLAGTDLSGANLNDVVSAGVTGVPKRLPSSWALIDGYLMGPRADLSSDDLGGVDLSNVDLSNANLAGANIAGADIQGTKLSGAELSGLTSGEVLGTPASLPVDWVALDGYLMGPSASLQGAVLSGDDLSGIDLTSADLSDANLTGADLSDADLSDTFLGADLSDVDLSGADLFGADLLGATSGGVVGSPSNLPADCALVAGWLTGPGVNLESADLAGVDLSGLDLAGADLTSANLSGASLTGADLSDADVAGAELAGVNLSFTQLSGVISGGNTGSPSMLPVNWELVSGYLIGPVADLQPQCVDHNGYLVNCKQTELAGADLASADLADADLEGADLSGADLSGADLAGADLRSWGGGESYPYYAADLSDADLSGANLSDADFTGRDYYYYGGEFAGADLAGANLSNANLSSVDFTDTDLSGADLTGANGSFANLSGSNLTGATLSGAVLVDANLTADLWSNTTCPDGTNSNEDGGTCINDLSG